MKSICYPMCERMFDRPSYAIAFFSFYALGTEFWLYVGFVATDPPIGFLLGGFALVLCVAMGHYGSVKERRRTAAYNRLHDAKVAAVSRDEKWV